MLVCYVIIYILYYKCDIIVVVNHVSLVISRSEKSESSKSSTLTVVRAEREVAIESEKQIYWSGPLPFREYYHVITMYLSLRLVC